MTTDPERELNPATSEAVGRDEVSASAVGSVVQAGTIVGNIQLQAQSPGVPVPRQLPSPPVLFTGRGEEMEQLTAELGAVAGPGGSMMIAAITGAGGIGKTWLALHWAYRHLDRFPDGQLYVNLRGFDPSGEPTPAGDAVRGLLDALGVIPQAVPADLDAQIGRYRSLVAGKRMLIVLDNARDATQLLPLLPGAATCTVLVTSRDRLSALVTRYGARRFALTPFDEHDARAVLSQRLGRHGRDAEPGVVAELLACCAGLPLALGIVAGRVADHPDFPLDVLARQLRDLTTRLSAFDQGDPAVNLSAVLSWSYQALTTEQAMLFAMLGLAPGPDIERSTAASLAGLPAERVTEALEALERVSLIQQHLPGRYRMHDLIRLYAADRAHHDHQAGQTELALRRMVDHYIHTAHAADLFIAPHHHPMSLDPPAPGCQPMQPFDHIAAWAWFAAEHPCLMATQHWAADRGWHIEVWHIARTLTNFHYRQGRLHDQYYSWWTASTAVGQLDDRAAQARAHRLLGRACARLGMHTDAVHHLDQALVVAQDAGNLAEQAHAHRALASAWGRHGDDRTALEHADQALSLCRAIGDRAWEADALNAVGRLSAQLGDYGNARRYCNEALSLARSHHDRDAEASTLDSLGYLAHDTDQYTDAVEYYQQAITIYRDLGHSYLEANTLERLGQTHFVLGHHADAMHNWRQVLSLYQAQQRVQEAERVQQRLDELARQ